jgi:hypothetical protein
MFLAGAFYGLRLIFRPAVGADEINRFGLDLRARRTRDYLLGATDKRYRKDGR